jgi:hypothetical protein
LNDSETQKHPILQFWFIMIFVILPRKDRKCPICLRLSLWLLLLFNIFSYYWQINLFSYTVIRYLKLRNPCIKKPFFYTHPLTVKLIYGTPTISFPNTMRCIFLSKGRCFLFSINKWTGQIWKINSHPFSYQVIPL